MKFVNMSKEDFAIEIFEEEALIFRLYDKRLFRVNQSALLIFKLIIDSGYNIDSVFQEAKKENPETTIDDIEFINHTLFQSTID